MSTCIVCKKSLLDPDWRGDTCIGCESRAHYWEIVRKHAKEFQRTSDIAIALFDKMKEEGYIVKP